LILMISGLSAEWNYPHLQVSTG